MDVRRPFVCNRASSLPLFALRPLPCTPSPSILSASPSLVSTTLDSLTKQRPRWLPSEGVKGKGVRPKGSTAALAAAWSATASVLFCIPSRWPSADAVARAVAPVSEEELEGAQVRPPESPRIFMV